MSDLSAPARAMSVWVDEPHTFVRQQFGIEPDSWQDRELREFPNVRRLALAGSKGCAKTALLSWLVWWTLLTQIESQIAATSINGDQLRDGLWKECAKWQGRSPLLQRLFHWSPERIVRKDPKLAPTWFASARRWNASADPTTQGQALAGIHGKNVMFVIDEAGGVPASLLPTADAVLATAAPGDQARVVIAGNTTSTAGALYLAVTKQRGIWRCVRVTSDPDDPMRTPRVSAEWAREQIKANGRDNPWVKINVFAEFPEQALGKLLALADIEATEERKVEEDMREPLVLGVDVGMVTDACVIYPRRGRLLYPPKVLRGASTIVIAGEIVKLVRDLNVRVVFIDAGGPGIGVVDQVRALGVNCVPIYFGGAADDSTRFANKRIEMHVRLAEWIKEGGAIGRCSELAQDLLEPQTSWNLKGQQVLEPKDDIKERLGRSPDWGDGAALTFAYPVSAPVSESAPGLNAGLRGVLQEMSKAHDEFGFGG